MKKRELQEGGSGDGADFDKRKYLFKIWIKTARLLR